MDSVNSVAWRQNTNTFGTASADKTVSVWDARTGLCTQTFYGHGGSVTGIKFNCRQPRISSCDSSGVVKTWDLRHSKELMSTTCETSANCISIDQSGSYLAVGCDGGAIYLLNELTGDK